MSAWQEMQYQEREEEMARNEWYHFVLEQREDQEEEERTTGESTA